jgi:hypothetical protein
VQHIELLPYDPKKRINPTHYRIKARKIDELRRPVKKRVQALIMNAVKVNWYKRILLWAGAKILLNGVLTTSAMSTIKEALRKHELLKTRK